MTRRWLVIAAALVWASGLVGAGWEVYAYATSPGETAATPSVWPAESLLPRDPHAAALAIFIHPDCACSRASLAELAEIAQQVHVEPIVVFVGGDGPSTSNIRGAVRVIDRDGSEARRFGARTSGYTVVYGAAGELRFEGGITGSRGHVGDNVGREAALRALTGASRAEHAVFGCSLFGAIR